MSENSRLAPIILLTAALTAGVVFCAASWPDRWPVALFWLLLTAAGLFWAWVVAGRM